MANSLAERTTAAQARRTYFLNIKGPELLDKYVGETERQLRLIFARAREKASAGFPVVVFFDEMESLFRTRGTGKSSDVETTIVPQLLTEIDGVEQLDNVIVIGASNRRISSTRRSCARAASTSRSASNAPTPRAPGTSSASTSPISCRCTRRWWPNTAHPRPR